jgi:hypothetical protein
MRQKIVIRRHNGGCDGIDLDTAVQAPREGKMFTKAPKIGLVIGTYGAVSYVQLHLEARKRLYPDIPILVHDDGSPQSEELSQLCADYGADFESAAERSKHQHGDLLAIIGGFLWAKENGIDLLVKMSRRFIPQINWTEDLARLALESQYATYSSWTTTWNFGFRTECVGFAVQIWKDLGLLELMRLKYLSESHLLVEQFVHNLARLAAGCNCIEALDFDRRVGERPYERNGYAVWDFMGNDRASPNEKFLWHNSATLSDYLQLSKKWGLRWEEEDFDLTAKDSH